LHHYKQAEVKQHAAPRKSDAKRNPKAEVAEKSKAQAPRKSEAEASEESKAKSSGGSKAKLAQKEKPKAAHDSKQEAAPKGRPKVAQKTKSEAARHSKQKVAHKSKREATQKSKAGVAQKSKPEDFLQVDESDNLGESSSDGRPPLSKLHSEQFALVNAQARLNAVTKKRRAVEDQLAKKLSLKEKTAVKTVKLDQKARDKKYEHQTNNAVAETTKIDNFLIKQNAEAQKVKRVMGKMKSEADEAVHDEYVATASMKKLKGQFRAFLVQSKGMLDKVHNTGVKQSVQKAESAASTVRSESKPKPIQVHLVKTKKQAKKAIKSEGQMLHDARLKGREEFREHEKKMEALEKSPGN